MAPQTHPRLEALGIVLPNPMPPAANYVPWSISGNLLYVAGQGPVENGVIKCTGHLGADVSLETAVAAARLTGLNLLAQVMDALDGDLDRVVRVVKLGAFVQCTPEFIDQPTVVNGASDLLVEVFGEAGRHTRVNVGAPSLPFATSVEIDGIFEIR
jgi:enamine deaminase RidA (YjgF/YER057c/UK114 family)